MPIKTEKDIYIRLIKYKLGWPPSALLRKKFKKQYGITKSQATDEQLYEFAKQVLYPIMDEADEIIGRGSWDLEGLEGQTEKQLFHPHYDILKDHIFQNHTSNSKILIILECSNSKPYSNSHNIKNFYNRYKDIADFAVISNPGIIPIEYSNFYPYRYDEWDHYKESQEIEDLYVEVNKERFYEYVKHFGYEHVIIMIQHPKPRRMFDEIRYTYKDAQLHFVVDDKFTDYLREEYPKLGKGLLYLRTPGLKPTREKFDNIIKKITTK